MQVYARFCRVVGTSGVMMRHHTAFSELPHTKIHGWSMVWNAMCRGSVQWQLCRSSRIVNLMLSLQSRGVPLLSPVTHRVELPQKGCKAHSVLQSTRAQNLMSHKTSERLVTMCRACY